MFLELTEDSLQQYVAENNKVMVQYAASWCGNCRIMKPKFKKLAAENEDVTFLNRGRRKTSVSRRCGNVDAICRLLPLLMAVTLVHQVQTNKGMNGC